MTESTSNQNPEVLTNVDDPNLAGTSATPKPKDSYVKLAMRNMVRKGKQSLWHFFLTTVSLVGVLVGLAYLTKP